MLGLFWGIICGTAEFFLLRTFVDKITAQKPIPIWIIPTKIILLTAFLVSCGLLWPKELPYAGIGTAAALFVGVAIRFACQKVKQRRKKGDDSLAGECRYSTEAKE